MEEVEREVRVVGLVVVVGAVIAGEDEEALGDEAGWVVLVARAVVDGCCSADADAGAEGCVISATGASVFGASRAVARSSGGDALECEPPASRAAAMLRMTDGSRLAGRAE